MVAYKVTGIRPGNPMLSPKDRAKLREIMDQWLEVFCLDEVAKFIDEHTRHRIVKEVLGETKA